MSLKSISLAVALAGAMFLVGCGGGSEPGNSPPSAHSMPPVVIDTGVDPGPSYIITLAASDANGDALIYTFDANSDRGGTVLEDPVDGLPNVEYTPPASFTGVDSFTFYVTDAWGISSGVVTVYIAVDNATPVADDQPPPARTIAEPPPAVTLPITLTGSDADGDALTFRIATLPTYGVLIVTRAEDGVIFNVSSFLPSPPEWPFDVLADVTYTPDPDYFGTDSFTFVASDHVATSAPATVTITVTATNDAPVAVEDIKTTPFETAVSIDVLANDTDVDNLVPDDMTVTIVTAPANGTAVVNPDKTIGYIPDPMFFGHDFIEYEISDGALTSNVARISITVTNPRCSVWGWGINMIGELGIGATGTIEEEPKLVLYIDYGWDAWGADKFTVFYDSYRNMWTCGTNNSGELADPFAPSRNYPRQPVVGGSDVEAGTHHALCSTGVAPNSYVKAWGANNFYQLGDGTQTTALSPVLVLTKDEFDPTHIYPLKGAVAVAGGSRHSLAVTFFPGTPTGITIDQWRVYSWGNNQVGQLGVGEIEDDLPYSEHALEIKDLRGAALAPAGLVASTLGGSKVPGDHIVDVVAFSDHSLALDDVGNVYAWGSNGYGECGIGGASAAVRSPEYVEGPMQGYTYKQIAAGNQFSLALTIDGYLSGWGRCTSGELAHWPGPPWHHPSPIDVNVAGQEVLHIAAGHRHALAATHEYVHLEVAQLGSLLAGPPTGTGEPTYYLTVTPADLGGADWTGGYVTNVTRIPDEVAFIIEHIGNDDDRVRIVDAGLTAFNPLNWVNGDELHFDTEDWHVYAWGDNGQLQCAQPLTVTQCNAATLVDGVWENAVQRRPIRVGAGPWNSFAVTQWVTVLPP